MEKLFIFFDGSETAFDAYMENRAFSKKENKSLVYYSNSYKILGYKTKSRKNKLKMLIRKENSNISEEYE